MSASTLRLESTADLPFANLGEDASSERWFAVHTRSRHEKLVAQQFGEQGVTSYLPVVRQVRVWSDRRKIVELPLFSCYVFVKLLPNHEQRLRVLRVHGVLSFVGTPNGVGLSIPEEQINAVRILIEKELAVSSHPFLKIGQRVRIRSGALNGVEGILVSRSGERALVISLDAIQKSLKVRVEGYDIEPV
ncbi:MAG TPA: UpxY family transcription antiterminator [Terriglobales bacterium]|nr:UpxY family transcription antiterminator [Terriglobales bacterium]